MRGRGWSEKAGKIITRRKRKTKLGDSDLVTEISDDSEKKQRNTPEVLGRGKGKSGKT